MAQVDFDTIKDQTVQRNNLSRMNWCMAADSPTKSSSFVVDSGCSVHISNSREDFSMLTATDVDVRFGTLTTSKAQGEGPISIPHMNLMLKDALYMPQVGIKLFSVSRWCDSSPQRQVIFDVNGGKLIEKGKKVGMIHRTGGLYELDLYPELSYQTTHENPLELQELVHRRLGHCSVVPLRKLGYSVSGESRCTPCLLSKSHRIPYKRRELNSMAKSVLGALHGGISGPHPSGVEGHQYFSVLIDEKSRYLFVGLHTSKSDVKRFVVDTIRREQRQLGMKVLRLRSDNGTEYMSTELQEFLAEKGFSWDSSPEYDPALNGLAERVQQTILNKARCLLTTANLPVSFWPYAVLSSAI